MRKKEKESLLKSAEERSINTEEIIKKFGEDFLFELLMIVFQKKKSKGFSFLEEESEKRNIPWKDFKEQMLLCGIKIRTWNEDFVDEDTGEVLSIQRWEIYLKSAK